MEKKPHSSLIKREKVPQADFNDIFVRYLNNTCSPEETMFLMEQLAGGGLSQAQQQLLEQKLTDWTALQQTAPPMLQDKLNSIKERIDQKVAEAQPAPKRIMANWRTYAVAAASMGVIAAGYWVFNLQKPAAEKTTFTAQAGERRSLRLPDGSQVLLNGSSSLVLSATFANGNREVELTGEAYFDVAQNAGHPFVIHTTAMDVKVLGTAFNVRSYPDEATEEASLIRGKIAITLKKGNDAAKSFVLLPMQKLVVAKTEQPATEQHNIAAGSKLHIDSLQKNRLTEGLTEIAWTENKLAFNNESLEAVADKMEKWYGISIEFRNNALKSIPYTGSFDGETLEKVMETIQYAIPMVHFQMEDSRKLILY